MGNVNKKQTWTKKRHYIVTRILLPFFWLHFKIKYRLKLKKEKLPSEGAIILCNHTMTLDPVLIGLKFDKNLYYMASKDLFQKKFIGKALEFLVNPIPKEKSNKGDMAAIKMCLKVAKENGNICIFPEGNRTFSGKLGNIDFSIVKLIKLVKKPLIICNTSGGYPSDPRWAKKGRKGHLEIITKKVLQYEEYKDMSNEELYDVIIENLQSNDHLLDTSFKGKKRAEFLERILYMCPVCKKEHTIHSLDNHVYCSHCNTKIEYREDTTLNSENPDFKFKYIHEWYDYQVEVLKNREFRDEEIIYQDEIEMYEPQLFKKKKFIGKGKVSLYNNYFQFNFEDEEIILNFDDIYVITLLGKKKMNIYYQDKVYQIFKDERTNLIKYMHTFYIIKNRRAGDINGFIGI